MDYTALHEKLAKEFRISSKQVETIRSLMIGYSKNIEEIIKWGLHKSTLRRHKGGIGLSKKDSRKRKAQYYLEIAHFLKKINSLDLDKLLVDVTDEQTRN